MIQFSARFVLPKLMALLVYSFENSGTANPNTTYLCKHNAIRVFLKKIVMHAIVYPIKPRSFAATPPNAVNPTIGGKYFKII